MYPNSTFRAQGRVLPTLQMPTRTLAHSRTRTPRIRTINIRTPIPTLMPGANNLYPTRICVLGVYAHFRGD